MSTIDELFAPRFIRPDRSVDEMHMAMARELGADSLRYLPVESIARAVERPVEELCQACITGRYPTPCGQQLYDIALSKVSQESSVESGTTDREVVRTYESPQATL
jgi:amidophosphoribosyltransferase